MIIEDPDAPRGTYHHWAVYDIPARIGGLPENLSAGRQEGGLHCGTNDFGNAAYDGPDPPAGHGVHHYHFRLGALDVPKLDVAANASVEDVWVEAGRHLIEQTDLVGTYHR